jgi:3-hydroxyisobutyrate dehydrogenase-like beta-hydroxyacid dehydrogenase
VAQALSTAGHETTVWNRSPAKSEALRGSGTVAASAASACQASDVILSVLTNYAITDELLRTPDVADALRGRTLVQMSTGTPEDVRGTASWAAQFGVDYLDAKVIAYQNSIRTEWSTILYSGDPAVFERWRPILAPLAGETEFVGQGMTDAATLDLAWLDFWYGASAAFLHAMALSRAEQLPVDKLVSRLRWMLDFVERSAVMR